MTTNVYRGRDGFKAETTIFLQGKRAIKFLTMKTSRGTLLTVVNGCEIENGIESMILFQDYRKSLEESKARCTENAVRTQHTRVMQRANEIVDEAKKFYSIQ